MLEQTAVERPLAANLALAGAFARIDRDPRFTSPKLSCGHDPYDDGDFDDTHDNYGDGNDPHDDMFN